MSNCIKCGAVMAEFRSIDKKICSNGNCDHEEHWPLKPGDQYMFKRDVEPFVVPRVMPDTAEDKSA